VWPAQRHDPNGHGLIPEGTRFRLPATYAVDPSLPRLIRMMVVAAKKRFDSFNPLPDQTLKEIQWTIKPN